MIFDWIFHNLWSAYGTYIVLTLGCLAVFYFFPSLRKYALVVAASAFGIITAYQKGRNAKGREEKEKRDAVVDKLQKEYDEIDQRNTSDSELARRLQRGDF